MNNEKSPKIRLADKIKSVGNILITVSRDPSVDELAAALALAFFLDKLGKHATAVFSGEIPPAINFLEPEKTFENNADSLRDFIISLDKNKADRLRYKVDGDFVRVFITPYRTKITEEDLQFEEGDFNVELVVAVGVENRDDLDAAISAHGKILHDATLATLLLKDQKSDLGSIIWRDENAGGFAEMVAQLAKILDDEKKSVIDEQISTALLTGVVAATDQFRNEKTTPEIMTLAANLMAKGANQQLIASELSAHENAEKVEDSARNSADFAENSTGNSAKKSDDSSAQNSARADGEMTVSHDEKVENSDNFSQKKSAENSENNSQIANEDSAQKSEKSDEKIDEKVDEKSQNNSARAAEPQIPNSAQKTNLTDEISRENAKIATENSQDALAAAEAQIAAAQKNQTAENAAISTENSTQNVMISAQNSTENLADNSAISGAQNAQNQPNFSAQNLTNSTNQIPKITQIESRPESEKLVGEPTFTATLSATTVQAEEDAAREAAEGAKNHTILTHGGEASDSASTAESVDNFANLNAQNVGNSGNSASSANPAISVAQNAQNAQNPAEISAQNPTQNPTQNLTISGAQNSPISSENSANSTQTAPVFDAAAEAQAELDKIAQNNSNDNSATLNDLLAAAQTAAGNAADSAQNATFPDAQNAVSTAQNPQVSAVNLTNSADSFAQNGEILPTNLTNSANEISANPSLTNAEIPQNSTNISAPSLTNSATYVGENSAPLNSALMNDEPPSVDPFATTTLPPSTNLTISPQNAENAQSLPQNPAETAAQNQTTATNLSAQIPTAPSDFGLPLPPPPPLPPAGALPEMPPLAPNFETGAPSFSAQNPAETSATSLTSSDFSVQNSPTSPENSATFSAASAPSLTNAEISQNPPTFSATSASEVLANPSFTGGEIPANPPFATPEISAQNSLFPPVDTGANDPTQFHIPS